VRIGLCSFGVRKARRKRVKFHPNGQRGKPRVSPLGSDNKLVIAPGILAGTISPCSQRVSVGGKSPLTGGIKEANAGGTSGQKMGRLGIGAIVLEGTPKPGRLYTLHISRNGAILEDASALKGAGNYKVAETLQAKYGRHVGIISIGPGGEMQMSAATVAMTDQEGIPARHAARGGLGVVMGPKGMKAIVIDDTGMPKIVPAKDQENFKKIAKAFVAVIMERPRVKNRLHKFGTAGLISFHGGIMPFRRWYPRKRRMAGQAAFGLLRRALVRRLRHGSGAKDSGSRTPLQPRSGDNRSERSASRIYAQGTATARQCYLFRIPRGDRRSFRRFEERQKALRTGQASGIAECGLKSKTSRSEIQWTHAF